MGWLHRGLIIGVALMLVIVVAGIVLILDRSYSASILVEQRVYYYGRMSPKLAAKLGLGYVSRTVLPSGPRNVSLLGEFEHVKARNSDIHHHSKPERSEELHFSQEASNNSGLGLDEIDYSEKDTSMVAEIDKTNLRVNGQQLSIASSYISHPVNDSNATVQAVNYSTDHATNSEHERSSAAVPLLPQQHFSPTKQGALPLSTKKLSSLRAQSDTNNFLQVLDTLPAQEAINANELAYLNTTTQVNMTTLTARARDFHFSLPCPRNVYKPVSEVMQAEWVHPLLTILDRFSKRSKQVTLVLANHAYQDVLLNWLISAVVVAKPPIENILVVALDKPLYELLQKRQVPSIFVPSSSILNMKHRFSRYFETIMMIRLGFMRLINRLGFDCAMYDIDAVILKNPQPLYEKDKSDIIGSRGELPKQLMRKWKVTICIGAVFIRSNTRTEQYWEAVTMSSPPRSLAVNDQIRLNYGLDVLQISWKGDDYIHHSLTSTAFGVCRNNLSVTVLPFGTICRYGCNPSKRHSYYIWHKGGQRDTDSKMAGAKKGHTWFLRSNWQDIDEDGVKLKGRQWLGSISNGTG